jgi:hypothetical protein
MNLWSLKLNIIWQFTFEVWNLNFEVWIIQWILQLFGNEYDALESRLYFILWLMSFTIYWWQMFVIDVICVLNGW